MQTSNFYSFGWHMHNTLAMLVDWVNTVRGGISIASDGNGTVKRPLQIISVDDGSLEKNIAPITRGLIDGSLLGAMGARCEGGATGVDFLLGPYSAALTEPAAKVAHEYGKLLVATATATSIYVNRSLAFGIGPIASTFMHAGIELLHSRSIKTIALIFEDAAATKDWCKGAADKAKQLNITIVASVQVSQQLNRTEVANALSQFRAASPDAVVGCTYYNVCAEFLKQAWPTRHPTSMNGSAYTAEPSDRRPRVWRGFGEGPTRINSLVFAGKCDEILRASCAVYNLRR